MPSNEMWEPVTIVWEACRITIQPAALGKMTDKQIKLLLRIARQGWGSMCPDERQPDKNPVQQLIDAIPETAQFLRDGAEAAKKERTMSLGALQEFAYLLGYGYINLYGAGLRSDEWEEKWRKDIAREAKRMAARLATVLKQLEKEIEYYVN